MAFVAGAGRLDKPAPAAGIDRIPAKSSWIAEYEYDAANLTLTTHLKSGAIYQHKFVTPDDFDDLQTAKNQSSYWTNFIKGKKASVRVKVAKSPLSDVNKGRK